MQVIIGSDHAGVDLKDYVSETLAGWGHEVVDCGAYNSASVDYPDIAEAVAEQVASVESLGILICGTGIGIAIAANKVKGIRAALCLTPEMARLAREHNNANIITLGARLLGDDLAVRIIETFLNTPFQAGRHQIRVEKISRLENKCRERS